MSTTWYGQINRTIWEIQQHLAKKPQSARLKKELLRANFLQRYEYDRNFHVPRDDRSFLFLQDAPAPACLLLHGAQGTPAEMREMGQYLYTHGFTVFCPRISRVDVKDRMVTWESWVTDAEKSLSMILEYTTDAYVVGLSLGATISIILCELHEMKGAALLAPALYPKVKLKERFYAVGRKIFPTTFNRFAGWNGEVLKAMETVRKNPRKIEPPMLILQARDDSRLSSKGLTWLRRCVVNPRSEVVLLPHGSHVLTRGKAKEEVFERVYEFLNSL